MFFLKCRLSIYIFRPFFHVKLDCKEKDEKMAQLESDCQRLREANAALEESLNNLDNLRTHSKAAPTQKMVCRHFFERLNLTPQMEQIPRRPLSRTRVEVR